MALVFFSFLFPMGWRLEIRDYKRRVNEPETQLMVLGLSKESSQASTAG